MKKYVFLLMDRNKKVCVSEQYVEACGMHDAFTKIQKIASELVLEKNSPVQVELKGVQYSDVV